MSEFRETELGRLLSFANGRSSPERTDDLPYAVYGSNGIIGYTSRPNTDANSIIIGRVGSYCGSLHLSKQPCWVTDNAIRANARDGHDSRFLFYLLGTLGLNSWRAGSGQPLLNHEILSSIPVAVPKLPEQRAIAHILGTLDDKIELNRRMSETLEAVARALFKSWFVNFDPVRAKAEGRDPGLPRPLADLFPTRFVDSELGEIPEGWRATSLDEIAEFLNGVAMQKYPAIEAADSLPVIKIAELRSGVSAKTDRASYSVPTKYVVKDGDFLFSWSGSLLAKFWTDGEGALNQHLFKVTSDRYPLWFVSQWVHHHLEAFQAVAASKATTMGHIQRGHLKAALTTCPPDATLERVGAVLSPLVDRGIQSALESRALAALRDALLPKFISGELRVKDDAHLVSNISVEAIGVPA